MLWMLVLGCAGGETEDSGEPVDGFVKLFAGVSSLSPTYCAVRADGTPTCFGDAFGVRDVPVNQGFLQILPNQQCGLDLDGEVLCWKEDWGFFGELPPGPYSKLSANDPLLSSDAFVLAMRQGSGELVLATDSTDVELFAPEEGTEVLDFVGSTFELRSGCMVLLDGSISCFPDGEEDGFHHDIPKGSFERVFQIGSHYCALDADGYASCFGEFFYDFEWEMVEAGPPLIEIEGSFLLTRENEFVLANFEYPLGEDTIQEGDLFVDLTYSVHECAIPLERPDTVECHHMDEYPMAVLPPGVDD